MRLPPSRRVRALLRELPLRLDKMTTENIRNSSEVALKVLQRLEALNLGADTFAVIQRARRVLLSSEPSHNRRDFAILQTRASEALAKSYATYGFQARAIWHRTLSDEISNAAVLPEIFVASDPTLPPFDEARRLVFHGEPYLAWQMLSSLGFDSLQPKEYESLAYWRFFCFGLISTPREIKATLRESGPDHFPLSTHSHLIGFAILLARGDKEWLNDRELWGLFCESARSHDPWAEALYQLGSSLKENHSRFEVLEVLEDFWVGCELLDIPQERILALEILASQLRLCRIPRLQQLIEDRLKDLSLKMSDGEIKNLWNLANSAIDSRPSVKAWSKLPSSVTGRLVAGLSLSFALTCALGPRRMSQLLGGRLRLHQLTDFEVEMIFNLVAAYLSRLKGPMMKFGQTISYAQLGLPPGFADRLCGLQSQSDPMSRESVFEEIPDWRIWLRDLDPQPVGVGSIGQVHRGRLKSGEDVAIKVRFPKIEAAIHSDFRILRPLLRFFSLRAPNLPLNSYLNELEDRINLECDFEQEARSIDRFRARFADHPNIAISRVHSKLSRRNILVTDFMRGKSLNDVTNESKSARDLWGQTLVHFVVSSCRDGDFNTDPHPGNFLFHEHQLVCLDFGSTYQMAPRFLKAWNSMILACTHNDKALYLRAVQLAGMAQKLTDAEVNDGFRNLIFRVPGSWTYPVKQALDPNVIRDQVHALSAGSKGSPVPANFIFGLRVYIGHLSVVAALGSESNWNEQVSEIMAQVEGILPSH